MSGWFELSKSKDGQYRFVLKAGNGEIVLTSELYRSRSSAVKGIASVRANCGNEKRFVQKTSANGKAYFNLRAGNHQVIGTSQMYSSPSACDGGMASVKANGSSSMVKDQG